MLVKELPSDQVGFSQFAGKFNLGEPANANSLGIYRDAWKYDFDKTSEAEILERIDSDPRPKWCKETFGDFHKSDVLELGPADGYNSAALERLGARTVKAIEGNVDAFLRCLLLKNYLKLQANFFLGDFTRFAEVPELKHDLLYASGVLYHLPDPVAFLHTASKNSKNIFLWTHFYDEEFIELIENERECFSNKITEIKELKGKKFTYYKKIYNLEHVKATGYIGGLKEAASWISRQDLFDALDLCGYEVLKIVEDPYAPGRMPAVNILATRR